MNRSRRDSNTFIAWLLDPPVAFERIATIRVAAPPNGNHRIIGTPAQFVIAEKIKAADVVPVFDVSIAGHDRVLKFDALAAPEANPAGPGSLTVTGRDTVGCDGATL